MVMNSTPGENNIRLQENVSPSWIFYIKQKCFLFIYVRVDKEKSFYLLNFRFFITLLVYLYDLNLYSPLWLISEEFSMGAGPEIRTWEPESIEWFIAVQAYSRSYDLAPLPPPSPLSTGDAQEDWERETTYWQVREEGVGEEPNHTNAESLILYIWFTTLCWGLRISRHGRHGQAIAT
jgi:hypothetical protein